MAPLVGNAYQVAESHGMVAGKVSGAGGSSFLMTIVDPRRRIGVTRGLPSNAGDRPCLASPRRLGPQPGGSMRTRRREPMLRRLRRMQCGMPLRVAIPRVAPAVLVVIAVIACGSDHVRPSSASNTTVLNTGIQEDHCTGANTVAAFGDSLTYALTKDGGRWAQASPTWLDTMAADLGGWCTFNGGVPSEGSAEIAVRQGGLRPRVTLSGNQITASGDEVPITAVSPSDGWSLDSNAGVLPVHGTLAGVAGNLQHRPASDTHTWSFLPDAAPTSPVSVPMGTEFLGDRELGVEDALQVIWAGTNNAVQHDAIKRDIAAMVRSLAPSARYLVIGTIPGIKDDLAATYGPRFVDLRGWLSTHGLTAAGIRSPTADDLSAVAAGGIPPSLTVEAGHFTQAGYDAIGHHLATVVVGLGWD
jgi:hypothetical protein